MKPLQQAIDDYIALRRTLGFKLSGMAGDLQDFASFLEQRTAPYATTELAMEWAMQPANHLPGDWAQRLSYVLARHRPPYGDSAGRVAPVPGPVVRPPLSVLGTGDSRVVGSRHETFSEPGSAALDIPLPVGAVGGGRITYQ